MARSLAAPGRLRYIAARRPAAFAASTCLAKARLYPSRALTPSVLLTIVLGCVLLTLGSPGLAEFFATQ